MIKIIISGGIVDSVLVDVESAGTDVEIIDIDKEYDDYRKLVAYSEELYADKTLTESKNYTLVRFDEEDDEDEE